MAEPSRTVRVSGLPADTDDDRLKDKLYIHFLRTRNGGGEIDCVTIVKATPVFALITFEDSRVAQRVIQRSQHILEVDGKKYRVIVTEHQESLDADKVIPSLSATVDHSQLPGGEIALTSLHTSHPDIQINYDTVRELYILHGAFSKVQAALAQLLGRPAGPQSSEDSGQPATSGSRSVQIAQKPHIQESQDQSGKPNKQREEREKVQAARSSDESKSRRDLTPGGHSWEDTGQTEGAALQLPGHPRTSEEDFLVIVDADMFQYLQKHCQKEYQDILSQYGVDVVEMTNQGLTSLFLQVATPVGEDGQDQECLKLARKAISSFFQENQTKICRAHLPKSILYPRGGLQMAKENLSVRHPKLLLTEDNQNLYIIGSSSDISEAKQFLLDHSEVRGKKEDVASLLRFPSYDSGSSSHADEQRAPLTTSSYVDSVDERMDQLLRSEEDERRAEGARKYKLAARFKDSGLAALGSRPTDFSLRGGLSPSSRQTRLGPMLGHDVLSETAEIPGERVSRALFQNTGGDILFKSGDVWPSTASIQSKNPLNSHLNDTRPKSFTSPLSATQSSLSGGTPLPPVGSGSTLKRASSFSGTPQQKAQVAGQKSQDDTSRSTIRARPRSSSFSNQTGKDSQGGYTAEVTVSFMMWEHLKEAYGTRVDDLTSDVQMKERHSEGSRDLTLTLRGANSSKVSSCQLGLQKLIDSVKVDFSVQELRLSELGITDTADETLQACCAEVRSRFKKVSIHISKKRLLLLGPEQLCSQVGASLREVFSGDLGQISEQQDFSASKWNTSTFEQMGEDSTDLYCYSNPQVMPDGQIGKANGSRQERRINHRGDVQESELVNGSMSQPVVRKDPVIKEKVKVVGAVDMDGQKTDAFVNRSQTGNDKSARHVNGVGSTTASTDKDLHTKERTMRSTQKNSSQQRQTELEDSPEGSRSGPGGPGCFCVCGETEKLMVRTKCGATFCSKCLDKVHIHCRVCHESTSRGIQGKMTYSKLHISMPGHKKDCAIKITYCIPDGIQEEGHPAPGQPFQGGVFEAFLPDCEKTRKLLPRLQRAFKQGLTFTVIEKGAEARVTWDCIPHKTSLHGGKSGNGYPDSTYLTRLSEVLASHGIEETPARS
ncbi:uncharacterized protein LOC143334620 [Chaetodon auriga]|uniref:uncharacterized protein LOC143334620 n=1 Tax=Chaetodon auriga TaxID=39042 RepID=UPI0040329B8B